jgi:23S rRNA (guanosine2251-2'-O)-methyltransferase
MKNKQVHLVFEQLIGISRKILESTSLADVQILIRHNLPIQDFISDTQSEIYLIHEINKFMNTKDTTNVRHHLDCLIVPFERFLQKKTTDSDFLISVQDQNTQRNTFPVRLILENLRSEFNVGSIFRSADCFGVELISLCGYTPLPQKTDMGTKDKIHYKNHSVTEAIVQAKQSGYTIIALETIHQGQKLHEIIQSEKICFVLGNERHGLLPETMRLCDLVVQIPLLGNKNSLNVAVAAGLSLYEYHRSRMNL